jgi:hypothetical protein
MIKIWELDARTFRQTLHVSISKQHNGQKNEDKRTNNDLQNIAQKTKDQATPTPQKTASELRCFEG